MKTRLIARESGQGPGVWERIRRGVEGHVRAAWSGRPGPALRLAESLFAGISDARRRLYDRGWLRAAHAPLPVISVGGITVGGSGKTPLTAELAGWLLESGEKVAVLTRGYADELAVHQRLNPSATVVGHPSRLRAARRAREAGATVALLDDGFQHLELARDLEIVLLDLDAVARTNGRRLPAGPFRESLQQLRRADTVVLVRRAGNSRSLSETGNRLRARLDGIACASCALEPDRLVAANPAAAGHDRPDPSVALTGVMKPNLFFERLGELCPGIEVRHSVPDHTTPTEDELRNLVNAAGTRGIVTTLKDVVKLSGRIPPNVPLWYVADRVKWESGGDNLRTRLSACLDEVRRSGSTFPPKPVKASEST